MVFSWYIAAIGFFKVKHISPSVICETEMIHLRLNWIYHQDALGCTKQTDFWFFFSVVTVASTPAIVDTPADKKLPVAKGGMLWNGTDSSMNLWVICLLVPDIIYLVLICSTIFLCILVITTGYVCLRRWVLPQVRNFLTGFYKHFNFLSLRNKH